MRTNDPELQRYYREVRGLLPCSRKRKKQIMEQVKNSVSEYLETSPGAGLPEVRTRFGDPQAIAAAYVESAAVPEIVKALHIRKRVVAIVAGVMAAALVMWGVALISAFWDAYNANHGAIKETLVVYPYARDIVDESE